MAKRDQGVWKKTACIFCSLNCGLEVQTGGKDGREIVKVRGDKEHPNSQGYLCEKAQRINHYQNAGDRLQSPMRRRSDGTYEAVSWGVAIAEIAERFGQIKAKYGGDKILYYGGGGQGNHLGGTYGDATLKALGVKYRSNALAQEKTGEFWVNGKMLGAGVHGDFEHAQVSIFIGKNPWQSHGFARTRVVLREIQKDPNRTMIVIDPRRSETAQRADVHLQLRPGTDAWCLAAIAAAIVQEDLVARGWLDEHTDGYHLVEPLLASTNIAACAQRCGIEEEVLRGVARTVAKAKSVSVFEDLGMQMNRGSTLGSYIQRLIWILTGHFARKGTNGAFVPFLSLSAASKGKAGAKKASGPRRRKKVSPVTGSKIIIGLIPCNVIPDEILTDHPERFRAMLIESGNPVHSLADSQRMREAMAALEFSVVIDVAMTETARQAHYVLPASSQFEKAECTYFNMEVPQNVFHLRHALFKPLEGTLPEAEIHSRLTMALKKISKAEIAPLKMAASKGSLALGLALGLLIARKRDRINDVPVLIYRALGPTLPPSAKEAAILWAVCHLYAWNEREAAANAGYDGWAPLAAERLFKDIVGRRTGVVYAKQKDPSDSWSRVGTPGGRIQLAIPELFAALVRLSYEEPPRDRDFPFVLSAGERRSDTTNTILRDPRARKKETSASLRISLQDAEMLGVLSGDQVRLTTRRGSCEVPVELSTTMQPGHISLPNGFGLDYQGTDGTRSLGVAPNELTRTEDRDPIAGTPWHKHVPARLERLSR